MYGRRETGCDASVPDSVNFGVAPSQPTAGRLILREPPFVTLYSSFERNMSRKANDQPVFDEATFVGNRLATCLDLIGPDKKTLREKYHVGEPRDCPFGTAEEMKRRGFVGIYEKQARHKISAPKIASLLKKATSEW